MVTEKEMAANGEPTRTEMGRDAFERRVWQQKIKSRGTIIGQLKRLGASCDWSREAFTMSGAPNAPEGEEGNFHDAVIRVFVEMYHKGTDLSRQAPRELGPAFRDRDLGSGGREYRGRGPYVAFQVPAGGRRDL